MFYLCEQKIPSIGITVRHHLVSLVMPNSYLRDAKILIAFLTCFNSVFDTFEYSILFPSTLLHRCISLNGHPRLIEKLKLVLIPASYVLSRLALR